MNIPRPAVFIFGAGATRGGLEDKSPLPPPIDSDFFDIAKRLHGHGTEKFTRTVLESVWELYGRTSGIGLETYYRDVETRELIGGLVKPNNQPLNWGKRRSDLEELIRRVYFHTTYDFSSLPSKPHISDVHSKVLKSLKPKDTIITFNYDLLIENTLKTINHPRWNPQDGYGVRVGNIRGDWAKNWPSAGRESQIILLKLHGSLNWTYDTNGIRLKSRPQLVRPNKIEPISILPPGWNKPINRNPYKLFWTMAGRKIAKSRSIILLGYSLPETDLLARALFAEVARYRQVKQKGYIKELHLVDPDQTVRNKFINLFASSVGAFGKISQCDNISDFSNKLQ